MVSAVHRALPSSLALMVWLTAWVYPGLIFTGRGIVGVLVLGEIFNECEDLRERMGSLCLRTAPGFALKCPSERSPSPMHRV